ncbi:hypothetical protein DH2020_038287 [Rehmannia glutinosa]|uniref:Uncharacterized protein n=1 Tax=Rehmannia glutinosa TaxID=99300 RepID=A0ABR0UZ22_REHGL
MSTSHHYQTPNPNPTFDEHRWIIHVRRSLDEDLEQESDTSASIFSVPKTLLLISPESYLPQQIALGPYHHSRPELYEMERYKLAAAKRFQKHLNGLKFHNLVDHLTIFEPKFRASYQKYLNFNGETIVWMMAIDSCFLLEFLQIFIKKIVSRKSHLVGITSRNTGRDAIIRDMLMLENQVPLFSLRKLMEFQFASIDEADYMLYAILMGFYEEISPIKTTDQVLPDSNQVTKFAHLLDFLYQLIVPKLQGSSEIGEEINEEGENMSTFRKIVSKFGPGPVSLIKRLVISKPVKLILTLPWKIISNLPGMIMIRQFEYFCFSQEKNGNKENENCNNNNNNNKHPLMEEISIPSVTELSKAGLKFSVTNAGILGIKFDEKLATFYLPTICLDINTDVVLRNLVAYEACNDESGPLIFTRYTELMNGIIDSEDDAKILRENGIVLNHLKSDGDVANLWNGMSKSIRLTKVPFLDKVIEDVNNYYKGRWKVRIGKFLKRYVFGSWQFMTLLAAVLVLFFMSLQAFCSVFSCVRMFYHRRRMN